MSRDTVMDGADRLESRGHLRIKRGRGRHLANCYWITFNGGTDAIIDGKSIVALPPPLNSNALVESERSKVVFAPPIVAPVPPQPSLRPKNQPKQALAGATIEKQYQRSEHETPNAVAKKPDEVDLLEDCIVDTCNSVVGLEVPKGVWRVRQWMARGWTLAICERQVVHDLLYRNAHSLAYTQRALEDIFAKLKNMALRCSDPEQMLQIEIHGRFLSVKVCDVRNMS
jgi:hypothetical protein